MGSQTKHVDVEIGNRLKDMIHDLGQESIRQAHALLYDILESDSKKSLYPWYKKSLTLLSMVLSLVNVKARYGWSDKSFTQLLKVVQSILPEENTLSKGYYEAKKILCSMGIEYKKIHACPNDYILYRDDFEEIHKCPRCGVSRYKSKDDGKCSGNESTKKGPQ